MRGVAGYEIAKQRYSKRERSNSSLLSLIDRIESYNTQQGQATLFQ